MSLFFHLFCCFAFFRRTIFDFCKRNHNYVFIDTKWIYIYIYIYIYINSKDLVCLFFLYEIIFHILIQIDSKDNVFFINWFGKTDNLKCDIDDLMTNSHIMKNREKMNKFHSCLQSRNEEFHNNDKWLFSNNNRNDILETVYPSINEIYIGKDLQLVSMIAYNDHWKYLYFKRLSDSKVSILFFYAFFNSPPHLYRFFWRDLITTWVSLPYEVYVTRITRVMSTFKSSSTFKMQRNNIEITFWTSWFHVVSVSLIEK